ncbi:MAG: type IV conjugative transfer system protein TraE [Burkholderiales bacterium]|nr:type IV conjugative transfer system protein TraE [Burkholderiales bacterium]
MRLDWLRADQASARRATALLAILLAVSMLATLLLAAHTVRQAGRERVVVVPPAIHKSFWVEAERASPEYLEQMGYFLAQLTLNVTPQSVEHQSRLLLQYAAPASWGDLRTAMAANAERIKRDGASTVFSPQDLQVDERTQRVGLRGLLTTFISDRRVSEVSKGYAIELQYASGRIFLKTFRETTPNDPLELQTRPGAAPGAPAAPAAPAPDAPSPSAAPAVPAGAPAR